MTTIPSLQHDCNACSGLCCVVFPFDAEQGFGFDKEALTPCRHLGTDFSCGIHRTLEEQGFRGCIHYSCHGAGQRVTRVFGEVNWRNDPARANEIYAMFSKMQGLHALQNLLQTAMNALGNDAWKQQVRGLQLRLEGLCQQVEKQEAVDGSAAAKEVRTLLQQLANEPSILALRNG